MTSRAPSPQDDPRLDRLMARGGLISLPRPAPDAWPHGPLPAGEKELAVGADSLTASYCTFQGQRFLRAHLLLPLKGARTVLAFEAWGSVSEDSWQGWLAARARGEAYPGAFAWLANQLPGFDAREPVPCNLTAGPPGALPRLQPQPGTALARAQAQGIDLDTLRAIYAAAGVGLDTLFTD
ncbi:MAG TPA: hypothetical protein DIU07_07740 [Rhodobacteraceae bacterium]|nr:hypothetical protein [Paracoccaceae bacterium]